MSVGEAIRRAREAANVAGGLLVGMESRSKANLGGLRASRERLAEATAAVDEAVEEIENREREKPK